MNLGAKMAKVLAIALMFWCAGTGCIMVAYAKGAMRDIDASVEALGGAMSHMSGSMEAHACCKAKRRGAKRSAQSNPSEFTQIGRAHV